MKPKNLEFEQKVKRTTRTTSTVTVFAYGGGYRVKYTKVSNSKVDSKLIAHHDEFYTEKERAAKAFDEITTCLGL